MFRLQVLPTAVFIISLGIMNASFANEFYVFPANGQSKEQVEQDKYTCYGWSKDQSGFDPMALPITSTPPPAKETKSGGAIRGALAGAALGAIIGDSSKDAKRGAAAGVVVGGVRQGRGNARTNQEFSNWEQQESARYVHDRNSYNRAYTACLEGKGYSVK